MEEKGIADKLGHERYEYWLTVDENGFIQPVRGKGNNEQ